MNIENSGGSFKNELQEAYMAFNTELTNCVQLKNSEEIFQKYLGKKGVFNLIFQKLTHLPLSEKALLGAEFNILKHRALAEFKLCQTELKKGIISEQVSKEWLDVTLEPAKAGKSFARGAFHPITHVQSLLVDIFHSLGFDILDGPELETDYYNFEALNFSPDHPARDTQDTFYLAEGRLLRTQTSNIQIRAMELKKPPFQVAGPGKVFRAERLDAGHSSVFHQFEGMMVGPEVSIANMLFCLNTAIEQIFSRPVKTRVRPGYFPFVEPGLELDIHCLICDGKGCSACKQSGWLELLGCGLTHPHVLAMGGIDPDVYSGFAFGMGIDRMAMLKFGIHDIRLLGSGNLNFAKQFVGLEG